MDPTIAVSIPDSLLEKKAEALHTSVIEKLDKQKAAAEKAVADAAAKEQSPGRALESQTGRTPHRSRSLGGQN